MLVVVVIAALVAVVAISGYIETGQVISGESQSGVSTVDTAEWAEPGETLEEDTGLDIVEDTE